MLPALEDQGIEVKLVENYPPDISDMTPLLAKVKVSGAKGVIVLSFPADSFLYMGQAKEMGIDQSFQFLLVGPTINAFRGAFGDHANGIVTIGHWSPHQDKWSKAKPFFDAYVSKYGHGP